MYAPYCTKFLKFVFFVEIIHFYNDANNDNYLQNCVETSKARLSKSTSYKNLKTENFQFIGQAPNILIGLRNQILLFSHFIWLMTNHQSQKLTTDFFVTGPYVSPFNCWLRYVTYCMWKNCSQFDWILKQTSNIYRQCASYFTEIITDVDKNRDQTESPKKSESPATSSDERKKNSPKKDQRKKIKTIQTT